MSKKVIQSLSVAVGAALLGSVSVANAGDLFRVNDLGFGYQLTSADLGEGTCGASKAEEGKCGANKAEEGKCGANKAGEGKCGANKAGEGKCGASKAEEGKCGEGKCGADKKSA